MRLEAVSQVSHCRNFTVLVSTTSAARRLFSHNRYGNNFLTRCNTICVVFTSDSVDLRNRSASISLLHLAFAKRVSEWRACCESCDS